MKRFEQFILTCAFALAVTSGASTLQAAKKVELIPLTAAGEQAQKEYATQLQTLREGLKPELPKIDPGKEAAFLKVYEAEKGNVKVKKDKNGKTSEETVNNTYNNAKASLASMEAAKPLLQDVDAFLSSDSLDDQLVKCAVLARATPRGLAEFAQQGADQKKLVDQLLADPKLMKEMLYAGGAKGGKYGKSMEIFHLIQSSNPQAQSGIFRSLALAIALELADPEPCGYKDIDPVKRYRFYEKSYLDKELDPAFEKFTTWQYRQVINDPQSEEDMLWMREMLWNYRPDMINAPEAYRARIVGLMNSEFGHKRPEFDEALPTSRVQQTIDKGGQCGPKAFFGRCLGRSFGIPVWGARLRSHTAMTYWTPKGWTQILGVSFTNGFWTLDSEPMRGVLFKLEAMARDYPEDFIKACRAQWVGEALEEERVDGMYSGMGGLWNALALNQMRVTVASHAAPVENNKRPWEGESYAKDEPNHPELLMKPEITDADKKITTSSEGVITIPAVACVTPTTNTAKIVFMKSRDEGMQLHYKRFEEPEAFTYQFEAPSAGNYALSAKVVTVNRDQFFVLKVNDASEPVEMKMPYTVGKWEDSDSVEVSLKKGMNKLVFTRTAPVDFVKEGWKFAGPEYGGISIKEFTLTPAK